MQKLIILILVLQLGSNEVNMPFAGNPLKVSQNGFIPPGVDYIPTDSYLCVLNPGDNVSRLSVQNLLKDKHFQFEYDSQFGGGWVTVNKHFFFLAKAILLRQKSLLNFIFLYDFSSESTERKLRGRNTSDWIPTTNSFFRLSPKQLNLDSLLHSYILSELPASTISIWSARRDLLGVKNGAAFDYIIGCRVAGSWTYRWVQKLPGAKSLSFVDSLAKRPRELKD